MRSHPSCSHLVQSAAVDTWLLTAFLNEAADPFTHAKQTDQRPKVLTGLMYKVSDLMNEMTENEGKDEAPCLMFFFSFDHVDVMLLSRIFFLIPF